VRGLSEMAVSAGQAPEAPHPGLAFPLVEERPLQVPNPLVDGRKFVKQGRSASFSVEPEVLHFGGFTPGRTHTCTLRIKNISTRSQRVRILEPTTSFFALRMSKLGLVAPGMCEEVSIEFTPDDLRYYYDCVRLHSDGENLVVPCHGYPVMNDVQTLPRQIDFGGCPINETRVRTVQIPCKTPVNFEFECTVVEPHPEITLSTLAGTVPALGSAALELLYRPTSFRTATMKFVFRLSQLAFEPITVTVRGNCLPGMLTEAAMSSARPMQVAGTEQLGLSQTRESFGRPAGQATGSIGGGSSNYFSADQAETGTNFGGGGGGRQDLVSVHHATQQRLERSQRLSDAGGAGHGGSGVLATKPPNFRPPTPDQTVEGIRFPPNVLTHAAVANVLTQEAGKLKIRDLKKAIDEAKQKADADAARLEQATQEIGDEPPEEMGRQLVETIFERKYREVEDFERSKEIKWFVSVGDANMTPEEIEEAMQAQQARETRIRERREQADRQRKRTELCDERVVFPHGVLPDGNPIWPERTGEEKVRRFGMERFVDAVRVVVIRGRVDVRLAKLRALFDRIGRSVEAVGALVELWDEEEAMHAMMHGEDGAEVEGAEHGVAMRLSVESVQRFAFPAYRESEFADREPIDTIDTIPTFEELDTFPLKVPQEASMMGYRRWPTPVASFHFPSTLASASATPPVRRGAHEEHVVRKGCRMSEEMVAQAEATHADGTPSNLALPVQKKVRGDSDA
jgi:hypothetical protein